MCTIRLGEDPKDDWFDILYPLDGTGTKASKGAFPCGKKTNAGNGKEFKLPRNITCDSCILQMEFNSKAGGKQYMCSDIEILYGQIEDCSG